MRSLPLACARRLGLLHVLVDEDAHDDVLMAAEAAIDADAVAFAQGAVRLGVLAVHLDLAAFAPALGLRSRLVQAGHVEPGVHTHRAIR